MAYGPFVRVGCCDESPRHAQGRLGPGSTGPSAFMHMTRATCGGRPADLGGTWTLLVLQGELRPSCFWTLCGRCGRTRGEHRGFQWASAGLRAPLSPSLTCSGCFHCDFTKTHDTAPENAAGVQPSSTGVAPPASLPALVRGRSRCGSPHGQG